LTGILLAKNRANEIRNQLGLGQGPIPDIFCLIEDIGIILFKTPFKTSSPSAMFMQDKKNYLVVINSNATLGHQIFSAAHELSHYYYDKPVISETCNIDKYEEDSEMEQMAHSFALEFLMPDNGIIAVAEKRKKGKGTLDLYDMVFLQQYFKVSWIALLIKLQHLGYISGVEEYRNAGITRLTEMFGYDTKLVSKTMDKYISKKYMELVLRCYENDEISRERTKEYLLDVGVDIADITEAQEPDEGGLDDESI
jgi:Predicted Zn peptidase